MTQPVSPKRTHTNVRLLLLIAILNTAPTIGCIALPYASPPARITVGGALPIGGAIRQDQGGDKQGSAVIRAGFHPQQLFGNPLERWFDLGVGYQGDILSAKSELNPHGPYIEANWLLASNFFSPSNMMRLNMITDLDMLFNYADQIGIGGSLGLNVEWVSATSSLYAAGHHGYDSATREKSNWDTLGYAHGEYAVGLYLAMAYRHFAEDDYWLFHGGITIRLPASIGAIVLWR